MTWGHRLRLQIRVFACVALALAQPGPWLWLSEILLAGLVVSQLFLLQQLLAQEPNVTVG